MDARAVARRLAPFLEVGFVLAVAWFMLDVRLTTLDTYAPPGGGEVFYIGTDPYYHLRAVIVSAANFPDILRFDPFTQYPFGTETGQFGTLFDLLIAGAAIGTGDPTDRLHVARVVAAAPAWFGALIVVPAYLAARLVAGRVAAVWTAVVLALLPGEFLVRSLAGYADHHVAEALFSTLAIAAVLWAAQLGRAADGGAPFRKAAGAGVLAGIALMLYLWTWPPGVLLVAILGLWVVLELVLDHVGGKATWGFARATAVSFGVAAVLMLPLVEHGSFAFNLFSILQPASLAAVALAAVGMGEASNLLRARKVPAWTFPAAVGGLVVLGVILVEVVVAVASPSSALWSLAHNIEWGFSWVTGVGTTANILTIAEARATCFPSETFPFCRTYASAYGLTLFVALAAIPALAYEVARRRKMGELLLLVWLFTFLVAATNQVRFNYYLAIPVAVANGWMLHWAGRITGFWAWLDHVRSPGATVRAKGGRRTRAATGPGFKLHQPIAIAAVALLVLPGLVVPNEEGRGTIPVWTYTEAFVGRPDHEVVLWHESLKWLKANTPSVGLDLAKAYEREGFAYPSEAYGVLAWWDYGHWIEVLAERPPVANPFQQAAPFASLFFTGNADFAEPHLAKLPGNVRYVAISDSDAGGKYYAITTWANLYNGSRQQFDYAEGTTFVEREVRFGSEAHSVRVLGPTYRDTMMSRLFFENADGLPNYRLVFAYPGINCFGSIAGPRQGGGFAESTLHQPLSGGPCRGSTPTPTPVVDAPLRAGDDWVYDYVDAPSLKFFEHVKGAVLTGTGAPGAAVSAAVELAFPTGSGNYTFTYTRETTVAADGTWRLVVAYSTSDVVPVSEGGTNLQVRATTPYSVVVGGARTSVHVPDRAVLAGEDVVVS